MLESLWCSVLSILYTLLRLEKTFRYTHERPSGLVKYDKAMYVKQHFACKPPSQTCSYKAIPPEIHDLVSMMVLKPLLNSYSSAEAWLRRGHFHVYTSLGGQDYYPIPSMGLVFYTYIWWIYTRWWCQSFFVFTPIWGRFPIWLLFFNWVETTN